VIKIANIRAGIAYVDVRLGSIEELKRSIKDGVEGIGQQAGKQLGDSIKKSVPPATGTEIGQNLNKALSKAFFTDAKNEFLGGFRALATGQLGAAKGLFSQAGKDFGTALRGGFSSTMNSIFSGFDQFGGQIARFSAAVDSAVGRGWARFQEFGKMLDHTAQKMGFLSFQIQNFGIIATAALSAPTVAALGFASAIGITTAARLESATAALKYLLPAGTNVEALLQRLKRIAIESPIFDTTDLIQYAQKFTAAGVEISKTERFLRAFSNIALVTGANTDEANRAVVAITQAFGKGKLQAEELNQQLGEAMPAVMKLLREELGVTQAELTNMVKEGKISGDDLIAIFTRIGESEKFLKGAAVGAQTLNGVWQEFKETLQTQLGEFFLANSQQIKDGIEKLGPALSELITIAGPLFIKLINGFSKFVEFISQIVKWYQTLSPGTQDLIMKLVMLGTVLGPVVLILGALMGAAAGIAAAISAIATPVGAVILAVVALGAAIAAGVVWFRKFLASNSEAAQSIKEKWASFYDTVIGPLIDSFKELWQAVVDAFNQIKNAIGGNTESWSTWFGIVKEILLGFWAFTKSVWLAVFEVFKTVIKVLGDVIRAIGSLFSGLIKIFKGVIDFIAGVFTGDWDRALRGLREIWDGLWDAIYGTLANLSKAIGHLVLGLVKAIIKFFTNLWDELVGHSIIPDMVKGILSWFQKMVNGVKAVINAIATIFRGFATVVRTFALYFYNGVNQIVGWFKSLPGKIKGALSGAASWLYNTGKNIVEGLVRGVKSMAGFLKNAILNLIPGPVRSIVANALGISSPSKVFMKYGKNVVEGFVLGLHGEQSHLSNSLAMFSDQPRFSQVNGSPAEPLLDGSNAGSGLSIENYYANDNVDPWRQAEDWYFIVTSRGGV
jgi:tape measure domain-containing protein